MNDRLFDAVYGLPAIITSQAALCAVGIDLE
jgi:hypothetical protein